ncbi:MAG: recombination protein RecR [Chloroflexi bacterium]|nr:recombination protein RecR [Chloroflexota bacterium]
MQPTIEPVSRLIEQFARLPGIGPKTAQRLTFHLLRTPEAVSRELAEAIIQMKQSVTYCSVCMNITDEDPCVICRGETRDASVICVVEEPLDVLAIERTREFRGRYHVLHGHLSPIEGIMPEQLKIAELIQRLQSGEVGEVILATNPNTEGVATAHHLRNALRPLNVKVTQIAFGLPVGGDLEYADELTLGRAIEGRREVR